MYVTEGIGSHTNNLIAAARAGAMITLMISMQEQSYTFSLNLRGYAHTHAEPNRSPTSPPAGLPWFNGLHHDEDPASEQRPRLHHG